MRNKLLISIAVLVSVAVLVACFTWGRTVAGAVKPSPGTPQNTQPAQVQGQVVATSPGSAIGKKLPSTQTPAQFPGGIDITLSGDAEMLLTDPAGRRTGFDARSKQPLAEAANAAAGDDSIDDPNDNSDAPIGINAKKLEISPVSRGLYRLAVQSTKKTTYDLELNALSPNFNGSKVVLKDVAIEPHARHVYLLQGDILIGGLQVSGGFSGSAVPSNNDARLLSFVNPGELETTLPAGTQSFSLIVCYDVHYRSGSLTAELDGRQISSMFHPAPGKVEKVDLPLHSGRNHLVLNIKRDSSSGEAMEHDQLELIVPNLE